MFNEPNPGTAFRGLPLSVQQEREITHFIEARRRAGQDWDTPELAALIRDMLDPPELGDEDGADLADSTAAERFVAQHEDANEDEREHDAGGAP
ncbi:hypothetical protein [Massilia litorea]|jgi:hypothetical protein|uniref:Uncharacterized protein n=1 Tax=Massilia litorea TaxID=2769491 RepID=A0A7L9U5I4_9BURK|nr:hypothetical protein [Massilia litorea]QOL50343.1 hypothetical protein LPB04_03260 [Massilia litorea]